MTSQSPWPQGLCPVAPGRRGQGSPLPSPEWPPRGWGLQAWGALGEGLSCSTGPPVAWRSWKRPLLMLPAADLGGLRLSQDPPKHTGSCTHGTGQHSSLGRQDPASPAPPHSPPMTDWTRNGLARLPTLSRGAVGSCGFSVGGTTLGCFCRIKAVFTDTGGEGGSVPSLGPASLRAPGDSAQHAGLLALWMQQECLFTRTSNFPEKTHSPSSSRSVGLACGWIGAPETTNDWTSSLDSPSSHSPLRPGPGPKATLPPAGTGSPSHMEPPCSALALR